MKRFSISGRNALGLVLAFVLALSLLGGCAQATPTPDVTPEAAPTPGPTPEITPEPTPGVPSDITPLLWKVTAPDGQIMYLFGSIHAADEAIYPLPVYIMDAFNECGYLAVEVDTLALEGDMETQMAMSLSMMYRFGETIVDDIGQELHARAKEVMAELDLEGIPLEMLDGLKPYMWANLLMAAAVERAGLSLELGLDMHFLKEAGERGMEILEVESAQAQLELMLGFSPPLQAALLEGSLDIDAAAQGLEELYGLWKEGDAPALEAVRNLEFEGMPEELAEEYWDAMFTRRKPQMLQAAIRYMNEGKAVFYVVGLLHMIGEGGLVDLLREEGYTVERVRP